MVSCHRKKSLTPPLPLPYMGGEWLRAAPLHGRGVAARGSPEGRGVAAHSLPVAAVVRAAVLVGPSPAKELSSTRSRIILHPLKNYPRPAQELFLSSSKTVLRWPYGNHALSLHRGLCCNCAKSAEVAARPDCKSSGAGFIIFQSGVFLRLYYRQNAPFCLTFTFV